MSRVDARSAELMNYWIPNLGARLYGGLDPYTPDKVKLIYDRLKAEFPRLIDKVDTWDDTLSLNYIWRRNHTMVHGAKDALEIVRGRKEILAKYIGDKAPKYTYQFGTSYVSG